jgi:hypothetical protein
MQRVRLARNWREKRAGQPPLLRLVVTAPPLAFARLHLQQRKQHGLPPQQ